VCVCVCVHTYIVCWYVCVFAHKHTQNHTHTHTHTHGEAHGCLPFMQVPTIHASFIRGRKKGGEEVSRMRPVIRKINNNNKKEYHSCKASREKKCPACDQ
jgi:hypothetical protein